MYPISDINPYERYIYMEVYMQQSILHDFVAALWVRFPGRGLLSVFWVAPHSVCMIRLFALLCLIRKCSDYINLSHPDQNQYIKNVALCCIIHLRFSSKSVMLHFQIL